MKTPNRILTVYENHKEQFLSLSEAYARASFTTDAKEPETVAAAQALANAHGFKKSPLLRLVCRAALAMFQDTPPRKAKQNRARPFWACLAEVRRSPGISYRDLTNRPKKFLLWAERYVDTKSIYRGHNGYVDSYLTINPEGEKALQHYEKTNNVTLA